MLANAIRFTGYMPVDGSREIDVDLQSVARIIDLNDVQPRRRRINFIRINDAALSVLPTLLARWLPDGKREGAEYVALNPRRTDRKLGSFRINLRTGRWADFATGDRGRDPISLAAYLAHMSQVDAAKSLATMLDVEVYDHE